MQRPTAAGPRGGKPFVDFARGARFLRVGVPTRVPFALDDDNSAAQLCVRMDLLALGEDRVEHAVRLETQPEDGTDWEVRLAHAREWTGETAAAVARALANDALDVASAALDAVLERVRRLLLPDASPPSAAFVELVASLEAERAELAAAAHDRAQLRELSARSASHASTVRNSGRSLGADSESATQASMRTQSMAY